MKTTLFFAFFILATLSCFSQSYLGKVIKKVNFREGPGTDYKIISALKVGTQLFIISSELENDFYNIIDIKTNKEGYIHKSYVRLGEAVKVNEKGMFIESGTSTSYEPEIEIFNNTSLVLTLMLNDERHIFLLNKKRKSL